MAFVHPFRSSQWLQAQIEHVRKRLELWTELAAFDHSGPDEIPPFLRLLLIQARYRVHALLCGSNDFFFLPAPLGHKRCHFRRRLGVSLVGIEYGAHEPLRDLGLLLEVIASRAHECSGWRVRPHVAARRLHKQMTSIVHDGERGCELGMQETVDLTGEQCRQHVASIDTQELPSNGIKLELLLRTQIATEEGKMDR